MPPETAQHTIVLEYNNVEQLEAAFAAMGGELACVIVEPIAGNMNFVRASLPFMRRLRQLCSQHGALLIFDEVMTGFSRRPHQRPGPLRPPAARLRARPLGVRQGDRRRHAAGGLWRASAR